MHTPLEKSEALDVWHPLKKKVDALEPKVFFAEGEVFNTRLGANIGFEQDGKGEDFLRPVLVVSKLSKTTLLAVPLTTKAHTHMYRFCIGEVNGKKNYALLSQIRVVDARRLAYKMGSISKKTLQEVRKQIAAVVVRATT
jgi:mRNA-degrading endonuclease toxin of MazEF toxin-antitoxin module